MAKVLALNLSNDVVEVDVSSSGGALYRKHIVFTSSQSWTFPATALPSVDYDICGGGGGGCRPFGPSAAFGGGGAARRKGIVTLTPGNTYSIVIGAGGSGGEFSGSNGGTSSAFGITAPGGIAGGASADSGASGDGQKAAGESSMYSRTSCPSLSTGPAVQDSANAPSGDDGKCSGGGGIYVVAGAYYTYGAGARIGASAGCGGTSSNKTTGSSVGEAGFRGEVVVVYWDTEP